MLLLADGCDGYTTTAGMARRWDVVASGSSGAVTINTTAGRWLGGAWSVQSNSAEFIGARKAFAGCTSIIFAASIKGLVNTNVKCIQFGNANGVQVWIEFRLDGSIGVYSGVGTLLGATAGGVMSGSHYQWFEAKVDVHNSLGAVEIRVRGVVKLTLTGVNTRPTGTDNHTTFIQIAAHATNTVTPQFDDILIIDPTTNNGDTFNGYTGDIRIQTLKPNGVGNQSNFAKVGGPGTDNYEAVNEANPDGDTSHVTSSTPGDADLYEMTDLVTNPATILAVVGSPVWQKTDGGVRDGAIRVRSGGANADGASHPLPAAYAVQQTVFHQNPVTSVPWTTAAVNAMQTGPKVAA